MSAVQIFYLRIKLLANPAETSNSPNKNQIQENDLGTNVFAISINAVFCNK